MRDPSALTGQTVRRAPAHTLEAVKKFPWAPSEIAARQGLRSDRELHSGAETDQNGRSPADGHAHSASSSRFPAVQSDGPRAPDVRDPHCAQRADTRSIALRES